MMKVIFHIRSMLKINRPIRTKKQLGVKVKCILHINNDKLDATDNTYTVTLALFPKATTGSARLDNDPPEQGLQGFGDQLRTPVDAIKAKTERRTNKKSAKNLVSSEVTHSQDVALVHAQAGLDMAKTDREKLLASKHFEGLKKARQDLL